MIKECPKCGYAILSNDGLCDCESADTGHKVMVTFMMTFSKSGECKNEVRFVLVDYPDIPVPAELKKMILGEMEIQIEALKACPNRFLDDK